MSRTRNRNGVTNIIFFVIVVMLLLGVVGALIGWAAREEGLTIFVEYNEKRYTVKSVNTSLGVPDAGTYTFKVGSLTGEKVDYAVSVAANSKMAFRFVAGGQSFKWTDVDCSKLFTINKRDKGFDLVIFDGLELTRFLQSQYSEDLYYINSMPNSGEYFVLTVKTSYGTISFPFGCVVGNVPTDSTITLSPTGIVF